MRCNKARILESSDPNRRRKLRYVPHVHGFRLWLGAILVGLVTGPLVAQVIPQEGAPEPLPAARRAINEILEEGNWAEALAMAKARLATPDAQPADLNSAINCLQRLGRINEADAILKRVLQQHGERPEMLVALAGQYGGLPHHGFEIAGEFRRGNHRGGGQTMSVGETDRVRQLQLLLRAMESKEESASFRSKTWQQIASVLSMNHQGRSAWRLQTLTDLTKLPEPVSGGRGMWGRYSGGTATYSDPPVTAEGKPVLYEIPDDWDSARNDGQRWRWAMDAAAKVGGPEGEAAQKWSDLAYAQFLQNQFGVQSLAHAGWFRHNGEANPDDLTSVAAIDTLADDETIARLATGVRRFQLPEGHRYIELYERHEQWGTLANLRLNRRQRAQAADALRKELEKTHPESRKGLQQQIDQIVKPWARLDAITTQPAGQEVALRLTHRNTNRLEFVAQEIDLQRLLADAKETLEGSIEDFEGIRTQLDNLGYRLIEKHSERYVGEEVAKWTTEVELGIDHSDTETRVTAPIKKPGAYFITARASADATPVSVVVWVADTVLVRKPTQGGTLYAVLDASSGKPIVGASVQLLGYRLIAERKRNRKGPRGRIETRQLEEATNDDGLVEVPLDTPDGKQAYRWLAKATTVDGRLAFLGFDTLWGRHRPAVPPKDTKTFLVTDRPVYRPEHTVEFKAWIARPDYRFAATDDANEEPSEFAHKAFQVELRDARGESVWKQQLTANAYGGIVGNYTLPTDATLGQYWINIVGFGGGNFRVEEYRKPEFEVTVEAPQKPTRLGEPFEATIRAKYYFGSPVTVGTVKYKVMRTERASHWIPPGRWDWLYGRGYGWLGQEATWRSDWQRWGCICPPPWQPVAHGPPELVAQGEAPLDANGEFQLPIETAEAFLRRPYDNHQYTITAEVTDASRRTIVGVGSVLAAPKPLKVTVWLDRGHYEVGDTISATIATLRPDGTPIAGDGRLRLLRITPPSDEGPPNDEDEEVEPEENGSPTPLAELTETEVQAWDLATSAEGCAEMRLKASEPGRYRLVYESHAGDADETVRVEGGMIFTIRGPDFNDSVFRYSALELVPDKSEYQSGDTLRLLVNTDRVGSTVALFVRPADGVYAKPQMLRMIGKSQVVEIPIDRGDFPNFFIEAIAVADGRVHTVTRQIIVPPESRVLHVESVPSADVFLPGQEGTLKVRITDANGEPLVGEATIAIYDRSIDAIAGGDSIQDIRKLFWDWRRSHNGVTYHSLARMESPVSPKNMPTMRPLGIFGHVIHNRHREKNENIHRRTSQQLGRGRGVEMMAMSAKAAGEMDAGVAAPPSADMQAVSVRSNFADTALWVGSVETDADGFAEVPLSMPESLTGWRIRVWSLASGARVGQAEAEVTTRKDLMVRLQAPRFLVETDEAILSAIVRNELPTAQSVRVRLDVDPTTGVIELLGSPEQTVTIEAGSEARIDWPVRAQREHAATVRATAIATPVDDEEPETVVSTSDAMRLPLPVLVHGAERVESFSAVIGPDERLTTFEINVPDRRRPEATRLEVHYTPTLVGAMLDALPYLIEYPHGCTEQTLNRFLPAAITRQTLKQLGVSLEELAPAEGETAKETNHPLVFETEELDRVITKGVRRLEEMQLSDGGWGWFSGLEERSSPHTTAVVVRGLLIAQRSGVAVPQGMIGRGVKWLDRYRQEQLARLANINEKGQPIDPDRPYKQRTDNLDVLVQLTLAQADRHNPTMREHLFADRLGLPPYSLAMLGMALHLESEQDKSVMDQRNRVLRNLKQFVAEDDENQTAYLNLPGGQWWHWYGSEFEAHAYFLKLLTAVEPKGELAPRLVKYLLNNRRAAKHWNSTRDTALVIEAMAGYALASDRAIGEGAIGKEAMEIEVWLDGQRRQAVAITPAEALRGEGRFVLQGEELAAGRHTLELRKAGEGRLYIGASLTNFSLEPDIRSAGLELRVERKLHRLEPIEATGETVDARGGAQTIQVEKYRRVALPNLGSVKSGDLIEVELNLTSKNDYEYLLIEDPKPAGCEPVEVRSGYSHRGGLSAYTEFRDQRVLFYVSHLARGEQTLRYRLRAETPGTFAALPTQISAMYAPDLRGNSDEIRVEIVDRPTE